MKKTLLTLALACQGVSLIAAPPDAASQPGASPQSSVGLQELDLSGLKQGYGVPQINKSVAGKPLSIGGRAFEKGLSRQLGRAGRGRKSTRPGANGVVELSPFEFLDRVADLVPPPRKHRHRYHGVFAPNSPLSQHQHPCRPSSALVSTYIGIRAEPVHSLLYLL